MRAITGLQLTLLSDGGWVAACCQLQRRGSAVSVQGQASELTSLTDLQAALPERPTPVALVLAGRGVLYRTLPNAGGAASTADLVAAALPGAAPQDFYVQHQPGSQVEQ
ncbi:MAG TPA: hypothetical protein VF690_20205, partial [Hymenobacter sp.]